MRIRSLMMGFCLMPVLFFAQKNRTDQVMKHLYQAYLTDQILAYDIVMIQYDSMEMKELSRMSAKIESSTNHYLMSYQDMDMMIQDSWMLHVNHPMKQIFLRKLRPRQKDSILNLSLMSVLDNFQKKHIELIPIDSNAQETTYHLNSDYAEDGSVTMTVLNKTHYISKMKVRYVDLNANYELGNYLMAIQYSNYKKIPKGKSMDSFLTSKQGKIQIKEAYQDYQFDQR